MIQKYLVVLTIVLLAGCSAGHVERQLTSPEIFNTYSKAHIAGLKVSSPFLKAHMKNGNLYIFQSWNTDSIGSTITGNGVLLNPGRDTLARGQTILGLDSVALVETNVITNSGMVTAFTVFTGITAAMTIYCMTNPKACFGSCPTFYVSDGDSMRLQAEGFSSSIAPALEATDVDALYHARSMNGEVTVEMRNEALETHVVRHVDLLAVPRQKEGRVFFGSDRQFWESTRVLSPVQARSPEGDCLPALRNADWYERYSLADENDLGTKETIDVEFRLVPGRTYGLVVGARQTLMPTYLVYQALAYMGNDAGHWLAEIERKKITGKRGDIEGLIGGIEVSITNPEGNRQSMGEINEHGPLAVDMHLLPFGKISDTTINIQLRMTRGAWRLDYVAIAELSEPSRAVRLHPHTVIKNNKEDHSARTSLLDSTKTLVTLPGDIYTLQYTLPQTEGEYELFLESRGYYLEWIRKEWIEEQNAILLAQMFFDPANALRRLAPEFKRVEPFMEECFWRSRYAKP
jgi:hypothetical protein